MPGPDRGRAGPLAVFVSSYIERVVNRQDLTALDEMVSPRTTVYRPPVPTAGAGRLEAGAALTGEADNFKTCPGKISDFQLSPLSASTDAVDRP